MSLLFSHPFKKLTVLAAFGGGYVLGAKAGRERYDQILSTANQVKDDPRVKQATSKVTEDPRVKDVVSRAEDILRDAGVTHHDDQTGSHRLETDDDGPTIPVPTPPPAPPAPPRDIPLEDEVVYSTGPDIEETIDELIDLDSNNPAQEQPARDRDNE